jgi:hypothetical protein
MTVYYTEYIAYQTKYTLTSADGIGWLSGLDFLSLLVALFFLNSKTYPHIILFHKIPYYRIRIGWDTDTRIHIGVL